MSAPATTAILAIIARILDTAISIARSGGDAEAALLAALAAMRRARASIDAIHADTDAALDELRRRDAPIGNARKGDPR